MCAHRQFFSHAHTHTHTQLNLTFKWTFNSTLENLNDLPALDNLHSNDVSPAGDATVAPFNGAADADDAYTESLAYASNAVVPGAQSRHRYQTSSNAAAAAAAAMRPVLPNNVYPYRVDSFQHFGTIACTAQNAIGQSAPCLYHIMAAEIPDAVRNCTASNATANAVHVQCVPGKDGGIQQFFHVEVYDEQTHQVLYNATFRHAAFVVKRLPSDSAFRLLVTAFNAQGAAATGVRLRVRTQPAPLLRTGECARTNATRNGGATAGALRPGLLSRK